MSGLSLITCQEDWDRYRIRMAASFHISPGQVDWGHGPQQLPCLVASKRDDASGKITSCYVYPADARRLLQAEQPEARPPAAAETVSNNEYHKHTAAMLLAVVHELVSVGVTQPQRFETVMQQFLADVDRWHEADKPLDVMQILQQHTGQGRTGDDVT